MNLYIVCVDDQREVLAALQNDLGDLPFVVEGCESAQEAWEVMDELDAEGSHLALIICDQVMPEKNGVDFLTEVTSDERFAHTRKLLLTGLASQADTIRAINESQIDVYVEKPWQVDQLQDHVRRLVTEFVLAVRLDYSAMIADLHAETLYKVMRKKT